jgi:GTP1/Obg family GTP-binding protein
MSGAKQNILEAVRRTPLVRLNRLGKGLKAILHFVADMHAFLSCLQGARLGQELKEVPVVVLVGAGQTGKTTLVQSPDIGSARRHTSVDELANLNLAVRDPSALIIGRNVSR